MARLRYSPPAGSQYSFSRLLEALQAGDDNAYEVGIGELLEQRSDPQQRLSGAHYLPSPRLARDLGLAPASAGGYTSGNGLKAVADAARPQLLLDRVGVQRIEVNASGELSIPVWNASTGSGWVAESATVSSLNTTVGKVSASGKMAAARLGLSRKMLLLARDIEAHTLREIGQAVAATIEAGFLMGDGTNNAPTGLYNLSGRSTQTFAAATPTYAELMAMVGSAAAADADLSRCVFMVHPTLLATLLRTETVSTSGRMVVEFVDGQHRIGGFPVFSTRHVTNGKALFFDPGALRTVYWGAPQLIADYYTGGKSLSGAVEMVLLNLCDLTCLYPAQVVAGG
jgi:hypothetical protein